MIAVRLNVLREVRAGHDLHKFCHAIPLCLCFFEQSARFDRARDARTQSLPTEASSGLAFPAGMEQLVVWPQASSTGYVLGFLIQPVDSSPRGHPLFPIDAIFSVPEGRTATAHHSTRGHHPGHGSPRITSLPALCRPTLSFPVRTQGLHGFSRIVFTIQNITKT